MVSVSLPNEFYPLLADYDPADIQSYQTVWSTFRGLPEFSRNLLTSDELPLALRDLSEKFDFAQPMTMFVSVMVRKIIFREWDEEQSRTELVAWCQEFDPKNVSRSTEILEAVKRNILTIIPLEEGKVGEVERLTTVQMTLLEALSQYPQLGQQTITETRVKLKSSVEPVRGSLVNWLKYYREELGVGYHDAMLRGQFLFRSQNGIKLTDEERGRIEILLRSIEDRETVEIDTEHQLIIFPPSSSKSLQGDLRAVTFPISPSVPPTPLAPVLSSEDVSAPLPGASQEKISLDRVSSGVGSMHVLSGSQLSPAQQALGTLHFSSKHVLPVEKEIRPNKEVLKGIQEIFSSGKSGAGVSSDTQKTVSSAPQLAGLDVTTTAPDTAPRPMPAPKRDVNLNYIPQPFRIDPMKREQPEEQ